MKKHNHLPFNDWLLSNEILTPEQDDLLQEHLRGCPDCRQIQMAETEVKFLFSYAGQLNPSSGFTNRWQKRFDLQRERNKKINSWVFLGLTSGTAVIFLSILLWKIIGLLNSPVIILSSLVYFWTYSRIFISDIWELLQLSIRILPTFSILSIIFFTGFCSLVSVFWIVTYRKLIMNGRQIPW